MLKCTPEHAPTSSVIPDLRHLVHQIPSAGYSRRQKRRRPRRFGLAAGAARALAPPPKRRP